LRKSEIILTILVNFYRRHRQIQHYDWVRILPVRDRELALPRLPEGLVDPAVTWIEALSRLTKAVNEEMPIVRFFEIVAATAAEIPGVNACAVQMANSAGTHLLIKGHHGLTPDYVQEANSGQMSLDPSSSFYASPSSRAFRNGEVICIDEALADDGYMPWRELAKREGYRSMAAVPLMGDDKPVGVLAVYSPDVTIATPANLELLHVLSNSIAWALRVAALLRRERQMVRRLIAANEELEKNQLVLDQVDYQHHGLMQLVFDGGSLSSLARWTEETLGGSVVIEDHEGGILAVSEAIGGGPLVGVGRTPAQLSQVSRENIIRDTSGVQFVHGKIDESGAWFAPIFLDGKSVGGIWLLGKQAPPDGLQRRLLERVTLVATVELWRARFEREMDWRILGDLMREILKGDAASHEEVKRRAHQVGVDLSEPQCIAIFALESLDAPTGFGLIAEPSQVIQQSAEGNILKWGYNALLSWREEYLEVLIQTSNGEDRKKLLADLALVGDELSRVLGGKTVIAAVSGPCLNPEDFPLAHRSSLAALTLARKSTSPKNRVVDIAAMGVLSLLLGSSRDADLIKFRDDNLGVLIEHDQRRDSQLLHTLRIHLQTGGSNQLTAQALFLHANSVLYRLRNIEKLCRVDLHDTEVLLRLQLALLIEDLTR
jgi:sugar diacid utilization regulator